MTIRRSIGCLLIIMVLYTTAFGVDGAEILQQCGLTGGVVVHIGCGDGKLTASLYGGPSYLVQGLAFTDDEVANARKYIQSRGIYGPVSIDKLVDGHLPFIDNMVNLVVAENLGSVKMDEVTRILCPKGIAYIKQGNSWSKTVKPRPKELDDWTHYLYDSSNNAVSKDTVIGPPKRLQWLGSPRWARHHDRMSSVSAAVSAGGRVFYIFDEGSRFSILLEPKWKVIARDAFNGMILWKRDIDHWQTHLWPLKSGPAQLPRRLVAVGDRVYVTLSLNGPVTALDAATGKTVRTYEATKGTEEIICSQGTLFALVDEGAPQAEFVNLKRIGGAYGGRFWDGRPRKIKALDCETGRVLWESKQVVLPVTLAADSHAVYFHNGQCVVALDRNTGDQLWQSVEIDRAAEIKSFYCPILLVYKDVVLFSGGETAGMQTGSWYTSGKDTMTALSARTGEKLWDAYHPPSGYRSAEDLLVANGLVWTGETTSGRAKGVFTGRDPFTGRVISEFAPDIQVYWFHHRCYRGKATENYLLMARAGTEFVDVRKHTWTPDHWVRGACLYGVMPANGMVYNPPHPCACYLESKMFGFNAVAPALNRPRVPLYAAAIDRRQTGPAYGKDITDSENAGDWPTYRHDGARSGSTKVAVTGGLATDWRTKVGRKVSSPVVADGRLFAAAVEEHAVFALDAKTGAHLWYYTTGGRVDSAPTIYEGRVIFGSADGFVYCLRATDGALIWRFRAAPVDQRMMSFEQIESVWPVHGSVLIRDGQVWCVAGRNMFVDGGMRMLRLDAKTGRLISEAILDDKDPSGNGDLYKYVSWLNMPTALPDILSTDGKLVYMRSQPFGLNGKRLPLEKMPAGPDADAGAPDAIQRPDRAHLFCPTGFLDDSWWHRTYWMYGSTFVSGWCGYYKAGKTAPAGRILSFDDDKVFGFGRKPQYYRWTTPIEHQLFAAPRIASDSPHPKPDVLGPSFVAVAKSPSLNPAKKSVSVEAWIKSEKPGGVILARGGGSLGYVLYLKAGKAVFGVRNSEGLSTATSAKALGARWVHLAGVLTDNKDVLIYVDGKLAGRGRAPGGIGGDPSEAMQIGTDDGSKVGDYSDTAGFKGIIDEVRVYNRALTAAEVASHASATMAIKDNTPGLVLALSFEGGKAVDLSGNKNDGSLTGTTSVAGRIGDGLYFTGASAAQNGYEVQHYWTKDLSMFPRAMVLADDKLFMAGPPDLLDEPEAFKVIDQPATRVKLEAQEASLNGADGSVLLAVATSDARQLEQVKLDCVPIFDGLIAAGGRLYMSTTSGEILALGGN